MSAITGIFYRDGRNIPTDQIINMNDVLSHRGKDGSGVWSEGSVALGHQMLCTTSESLHEKLPFYDEETELSITADARIDNREELSKLLKLQNNENIPDSIYILKAYEKWGESCLQKILGDFAFAIWDDHQKKLFCARDHMGVKPFFYNISENTFFFATEIKALFANPEIKKKLDEKKVAYFLSGIYDDREITFYENISRLPAANKLVVTFDNFILEKYWELDYKKRIILDSESEYTEYFIKIFNNAIKCRLRSASPLGAMLSGGLDSSSIVCTAREILLKNGGYPLKTFSEIFKRTPEADESEYIDHVLQKGFLNPHFVNVDDHSPILNLDPILWQNDEPIRAFNLYYNYLLYELAQKEKVNILLDGFGGDSTVSHGKGLLIDYIRNNHWIEFFKEIKSNSDRLNQNRMNIFIKELLKVYPNLFIWNFVRNKNTHTTKKILKKEFVHDIHLDFKIKSFRNNKLEIREKARQYHFNTINSGVIQHTLEEFDKISAFFNIEPRYPFFDVRLMEFCLAVPSNQKRKYGWDRFLMRQAMTNTLPKEIQWRKNKKTGIKSSIRNFYDFDRDFIEYALTDNFIQNYVDSRVIQQIFKKFKNNHDSKDFFDLWSCVSLGLWLNQTNKNYNEY